jgi:hypothetical protein
VLLVDEAWQATYGDLGALGALATQVVCVGDAGQIAPVVTGSTARWDGQETGPHQPAPPALIAAYGEAITVHELTNSWRLGPRTCALLSEHFYAGMPFRSRRPEEAVVDPAGRKLPEIDCRLLDVRHGPNDPALLGAVAARVRELTWHSYRRGGQTEALSGGDIAVVVPHVAQAGAVRALLNGLPDVLIGTANGLQGLEPLERGRMCVTLSRHRARPAVVATSDPAGRYRHRAAADHYRQQ